MHPESGPHVSHNFKLVRDIAPISDGVKKMFFYHVNTNHWRKLVQSGATFVNRLEMNRQNSRDKIRWIHAAVARQTRNRR